METLDTPSEQPGTIKKHHETHPGEKLHAKKDHRSPEPAPAPEPPWGDLSEPVAGSDWLE
jgi:hypothetical protein